MRFFVLGDISVDILYFLDRIPEPGEEVPSRKSLMTPGGAGATLAVQLASLGNTVQIAGRIGRDPFANVALEKLQETGVDLKYVQTDLQESTSSVLLFTTPGGQRAMVSTWGASRFLDPLEFKPKMLDQIDAIVMSAYALVGGPQKEYAMGVLEAAATLGIPVFADLGSGAIRAAGKELLDELKGVPYLLLNQQELRALTGEKSISQGSSQLAQWGLDTVAVKVGAQGSIVITTDKQELVEPFPVAEVTDTTGAGDAYTAAFAHAIMSGKDAFTAARAGNLAGSIAASAVGAQARLITEKDLEPVLGGGSPKEPTKRKPKSA